MAVSWGMLRCFRSYLGSVAKAQTYEIKRGFICRKPIHSHDTFLARLVTNVPSCSLGVKNHPFAGFASNFPKIFPLLVQLTTGYAKWHQPRRNKSPWLWIAPSGPWEWSANIRTSLRPSPGNHGLFQGNHPQMAELFRLVTYYNLPRFHGCFTLWNWQNTWMIRWYNVIISYNIYKVKNHDVSCEFTVPPKLNLRWRPQNRGLLCTASIKKMVESLWRFGQLVLYCHFYS